MAIRPLQGMYVDLKFAQDDSGSHAHLDITVAQPANIPDGWYWYGQRARKGHIAPRDVHGRYLLIRQNPDSFDPNSPIAQANGFYYRWGMKNAGGSSLPGFGGGRECYLAMYQVDAPGGYVAISDIFNNHTQPQPHNFVCVSVSCVLPSPFNGMLWNDHNTGAEDDGSLWCIPDDDPDWQLFRAHTGYDQPPGTGYRLNMDMVHIVGA
jgi:hypothetical protein